MNFDLNKYLEENVNPRFHQAPRIFCNDGFSMSVQASYSHYCQPRVNKGYPYYQVEVGFPSDREESLMEYIDGGSDADPVQSVYGYVPVAVVEEIVNRHGGMKDAKAEGRA